MRLYFCSSFPGVTFSFLEEEWFQLLTSNKEISNNLVIKLLVSDFFFLQDLTRVSSLLI